MDRMAGSSITRRIAMQKQNFLRCFAPVLNNYIREVMEARVTEPILEKVVSDIKLMKKAVKDPERSGWK